MAMTTYYNPGSAASGVASLGFMGNPMNLVKQPYTPPPVRPRVINGVEVDATGKPIDKRTAAEKLRDEFNAKTAEAKKSSEDQAVAVRGNLDKALALYDAPGAGVTGLNTQGVVPGLNGYENYTSIADLMSKAGVGDVRQSAIARGIYNSTPALNAEVVKSGDVSMKIANMNNSLLDSQRNFEMQKAAAKAGILGDKAKFEENITNAYPDLNQLIELEKLVGSGSQEGLQAPVIGGGGGGSSGGFGEWNNNAAALGYGLPTFMGGGYQSRTPRGSAPLSAYGQQQLTKQKELANFRNNYTPPGYRTPTRTGPPVTQRPQEFSIQMPTISTPAFKRPTLTVPKTNSGYYG